MWMTLWVFKVFAVLYFEWLSKGIWYVCVCICVCVCVCVPMPCPAAALEAVRAGPAGVCLERARRVSALWWQYHMTPVLCRHMLLMQWWSEARPEPLRAPPSRSLESESVFTASKWQTEQVGRRKNKWMGFWLAVKTSAWGTFIKEVHWSVQSNFKQLWWHQSWLFFSGFPAVCRTVILCKIFQNYTWEIHGASIRPF